MVSKRKVLVTGGAGFIGSNVVAELVERGYSAVVLDNFDTGRGENLDGIDGDCDIIEGDIRDRDAVRDAVEGAKYVIHEAALTSVPGSVEEPAQTSEINCTGTAVVLEEALEAGIEKVAVASSAAVYGDGTPPLSEDDPVSPESPYALSKRWTESLAQQFDEIHSLETVVLRYFNVYGPGQDADSEYAAVVPAFVSAVLDDEQPIVYGNGEQTRDFIHVRDVAEATVESILSDATGTYNVASGTETSVNELLNTVLEATSSDMKPRYEPERKGDIERSYADVSKIRDEIGFETSVDLREGIQTVVDSYEENARNV
jgi:nucleoside-diphosphate-sugar epimerase